VEIAGVIVNHELRCCHDSEENRTRIRVTDAPFSKHWNITSNGTRVDSLLPRKANP
jgi:hypothetical protein